MTARPRDSGVVLVNVLIVLALAASLLVAMLTRSDQGIARSQIYSEASQALMLALSGEASAITALRRDLRQDPLSDHGAEGWAKTGQTETAIAEGSFALNIADAQAKLNLRGVPQGGLLAQQRVQRLMAALDLPPDLAASLIAGLTENPRLADLDALARRAGLSARARDRLARFTTLLPEETPLNLNTAPDLLFGVVFDNPVQIATLLKRRQQAGFLTADDLKSEGVILPPGTGFASRFFRVRTMVRFAGAVQNLDSLLQRFPATGQVAVIQRRTTP